MPDMSFMRMFSSKNEEEIGLGGQSEGLIDLSPSFTPILNEMVVRVVEDYHRYGMDLNRAIAREATARTLNDEQIKRVLEAVNQQVYLDEYKKKRSETERVVEFPLAQFDRIKAIIDGDIPPVKKEAMAAAKERAEGLGKTASDKSSELSFLNFRTGKSVNLAENKPTSQARLNAVRLSEKLAQMEDDYQHALKDMRTGAGQMAEALVKYARVAYYEPQYLFGKVCSSAQLTKTAQLCIQESFARHTKNLKRDDRLHAGFPSRLELVDAVGSDPSPFSLGDKSLLKQAEQDSMNNVSVPPIVLGDRTLMKDYNKLVDLAMDIQKRQETLAKKQTERDEALKMMPEKLNPTQASKTEGEHKNVKL